MRLFLKIITLFIILSSCNTEDDSTLFEQVTTPETLNPEFSEVFIFMEFQDKEIVFNEDYKYFLEENLGSQLISRFSSEEIMLYSLKIWGIIENKDSNTIKHLGMNIDRFVGEGIYKTGTGEENNCTFFDFGISWQSHYDNEQEGFIEITYWDGEYIEGNYAIKVFNANNILQSGMISGNFRLMANH